MSLATSRTTQVYHLLLSELRAGTRKPGATISVKDAAASFRVSPTPVREALERLVGEGVVAPCEDRTGFMVPRIGVRGYTSLTDTFCLLSKAAFAANAYPQAASPSMLTPDRHDAARTTEIVFDVVFHSCPNAVLIWLGMRLSMILAPYRAVEPDVLTGWDGELVDLHAAFHQRKRAEAAIRSYGRRRQFAAAEIVDRVEQDRKTPSISNIPEI